MAPLAVNDPLPDGTLFYLDKDGKMQAESVHSLLAHKKAIIIGVPGAFTPTCSGKHIPSYIAKASELKAAGVDELLCITVNDPFVVAEWSKTYPEDSGIRFFADGSATYTKSLGLDMDLTERGMGIRARRFALLVDDLVVKVANVEEGGQFTVSDADKMLAALQSQ